MPTSRTPGTARSYFGEQHLHTSNSPDAFAAGSRQSWDDAFRYGRGEEVTLHTIATKNKIKRGTPYDFMAITDHAEYFGVMPRMIDPKDPLSKSDLAKRLQKQDPTAVMDILHDILTSTGRPEFVAPELLRGQLAELCQGRQQVQRPRQVHDPDRL